MFDMFLDVPLYRDRILKIIIFIKRLLWERARYVLAAYNWPIEFNFLFADPLS